MVIYGGDRHNCVAIIKTTMTRDLHCPSCYHCRFLAESSKQQWQFG